MNEEIEILHTHKKCIVAIFLRTLYSIKTAD